MADSYRKEVETLLNSIINKKQIIINLLGIFHIFDQNLFLFDAKSNLIHRIRENSSNQSLIIAHSNKSIEYERQFSFKKSCLIGTLITFHNLSYSDDGRKQILKNASGFFPGGKISAIIGSSESEKTILLNILACRLEKSNHNHVSGQRHVNGHNYDFEKFNNFAAYVMQNDILLESQTPKEAITFVAQLKYSNENTVQQKVADTIKLLQLSKCENTFVGGLFRKGLSGGERKRLSIAIELVSDPHCLILDEPTSGLDTYTAFHLIHQLKNLAKLNNKTIIFTIHQPSNDIYQELDQLIVMYEGNFIFQGSKENAEFYFNKIGFKYPKYMNPVDHFISLTHSQQSLNYLIEQYSNFIHPQVDKIIQQQQTTDFIVKSNGTSNCRKIVILLKRNYQNYVRNVFLLATRIIIAYFLGIRQGLIYWELGLNNRQKLDNLYLVQSVFFLTTTFFISNALATFLVFDLEKSIFIREVSRQYSILVYFISKLCLEIPVNIISTLIQFFIAYYVSHIHMEWWEMFQTCVNFTTLAMCGNSIGIMCGCVMKQKALALSVTPFILIRFIMYGGYMVNQNNYYPWTGWVQYINPLKYAFEAEITIETDQRFYLIDPLKNYNLSLGVWLCIGLNFLCFLMYRILALVLVHRLRCKLQ